MKKIVLSTGAIGAIIAPIALVISCSPSNEPTWTQLDLKENAQIVSALKENDSSIAEITKIEVIYDTELNPQGLGQMGFGMAGQYQNGNNFNFKFCMNISKLGLGNQVPIINGSFWWIIGDQPKVEISMQKLINNQISASEKTSLTSFASYLKTIFEGLNMNTIFPSIS